MTKSAHNNGCFYFLENLNYAILKLIQGGKSMEFTYSDKGNNHGALEYDALTNVSVPASTPGPVAGVLAGLAAAALVFVRGGKE